MHTHSTSVILPIFDSSCTTGAVVVATVVGSSPPASVGVSVGSRVVGIAVAPVDENESPDDDIRVRDDEITEEDDEENDIDDDEDVASEEE